MHSPSLIINQTADAAIVKRRIVKVGAADGSVAQAAAAADKLLGVTTGVGADAAGDRVDVIVTGAADLEYGGNVTRGDLLTSDASGRAVTAAPAAGANVRVVGIALESGVAGDIGSVLLSQGTHQG